MAPISKRNAHSKKASSKSSNQLVEKLCPLEMSPLNPSGTREDMKLRVQHFIATEKSTKPGEAIAMLKNVLKAMGYKFMVQLRKPIQRNMAILSPNAKKKV
jgi:hypothetical protein